MIFRQLFDCESCTYTYLIADENSKQAAIIDSVLEQAERDIQLIRELGLTLKYSLETHLHADHITAAAQLKQNTDCEIVYPANSKVVNADKLINDNEIIKLGDISMTALYTPGHTDCSYSYLIDNKCVLTGDSLFIRGCGRTDFQNGDAATHYQSITQRLFTLADHVLVYPGHDYKGMTCSTIGEEKRHNPRLANKTQQEYVDIMAQLNLAKPKKIDIAVPANLHCGQI